ncbi:MAG: hypothetical protein CXT78_09775 [Thaumarchaeota archaeon]|jgi:hypothetical protein|nr:MAG: hypothetical protein CXT78_09775 [Nitrososphaerota archaeon]
MRLFRDEQLTIKDLKNILLWYERTNENNDDVTMSDNRTMIKIQAMLIYQEESAEAENQFRRRHRD